MTQEQQFELQAFLDGELSANEAQRVERALANDAAGAALLTELRMTKSFLAGNEPEAAVPETREFYWSKIARALEAGAHAEAAAAAPATGWFWSLRRYLAPVSGLALVAILAIGITRFSDLPGIDDSLRFPTEVENLSDEVSTHSFRSRSGNMFVVWIEDRPAAEEKAVDWLEEEEEFLLQ